MFPLPSNQPRIQEKITTNTVIVARAVVYLLFVFIHTFINPVRLPWWLSGIWESACSAGDLGSIPGLGISPGGGHGNAFQYACLENSMDRVFLWTIVHRVTQSQTRLKRLSSSSIHPANIDRYHLWDVWGKTWFSRLVRWAEAWLSLSYYD